MRQLCDNCAATVRQLSATYSDNCKTPKPWNADFDGCGRRASCSTGPPPAEQCMCVYNVCSIADARMQMKYVSNTPPGYYAWKEYCNIFTKSFLNLFLAFPSHLLLIRLPPPPQDNVGKTPCPQDNVERGYFSPSAWRFSRFNIVLGGRGSRKACLSLP